MNPQVDKFYENATQWHDELKMLREIVLSCDLTEEFKWRQPCYTFQGKNILIVSGFKNYCALNLFNGGVLNDSHKILVKPGENTQAGRQIRFTDSKEIAKLAPILKAYIFEAIEAEKLGVKIESSAKEKLDLCEELENKLQEDSKFKKAFEKLTPGRKRAYNMFFSAAKQPATRDARIEKYRKRILLGKGMNDCVCGLSKKFPICDGSHKLIKGGIKI